MNYSFKSRFWLILGLMAILAVTTTSAVYAHERREVDKYQFVVGFIVEPAFEGLKNGLDLRVTKKGPAAEDDHGAMSMEGMIDVEEHGAIFSSPALSHEEIFSFEIPLELENLTIPYHSHLNHEMTGSITVSDDAELSGTVEIELHDGAFHPADITVQPHTTLQWTNGGEDPQSITSGIMAEPGHMHEPELVDLPVEGLEDTLQVEITHVPSGTSKALNLRTLFRDPGHYTADLIPTAPGIYQFRIFGTIEDTPVDETFVSRGGGGGFGDMESSADLQFPEQLPQVREIESAVKGAQSTAQESQVTASNASTLAIVGIVLGALGIASGAGGLLVGMRRK